MGDVSDTATAGETFHAQATRTPLPALVNALQGALGQRLVAHLAGVADAKAVGKWARAGRAPHPDAERRLRDAFQVAQLLLRAESADTVRAWFVGVNPALGDRAPAAVLAEMPGAVLEAARAFVADG